MSDAQTFALQLSAFTKKAKDNSNVVVRVITQNLLRDVVMATPVGNPSLWKHKPPKGYVGGRLRANWNVSLTMPDETTTGAIDKAGGATIARGTEVLGTRKNNEDIYIINALPYAIPVEYGHSTQAPAGMVRVSVIQAQTYVDAAVASLDK